MAVLNKLKDAEFRKIKSTDTEQLLTDGGGLFVRVRSAVDGGSVSFRLAYRVDGKQKWLTVGTYPTMSLKDARDARDTHKANLKEGRDPALDKQLEKQRQYNIQLAEQAENAKQQARMTVNKLFERWETLDLSIRRKDKGKDIRRIFEKDVLPYIGAMSVEDVRKSHIAAILDTLLARDVPRLTTADGITATSYRTGFSTIGEAEAFKNGWNSHRRKVSDLIFNKIIFSMKNKKV
jgi:hypothetical protein